MDSVFEIAAVVDVASLNAGFNESTESARDYVEGLNVMFDEAGGKAARAFGGISDASKEMSASISGDQVRIAEATAVLNQAQQESRRALVLVKNGFGDSAAAARLYAATLTQVSSAESSLKGLKNASSAPEDSTPSANAVVSTAAQVDTSALSQREAAATLELAGARAALKEVTDSLGASDLDEATKLQALGGAQDLVREKEAALTAVKAERIGIEQATNRSLEEQAAAENARARAAEVAAGVETGAYAATSAGSQRAAAAQIEVAAANTALKAATAEASNEMLTEAQRVAILAPALDRARTATVELAAANEELAVASHSVVSGQQAASASIRALEGNAGLRAVENFIAKTLGLGPALQAIFPLVGAFAFGKILFDLGEKVYDVEQKAVHAAAATADAFDEMHIKAQVANDDLAIQNDKLGDEIAKLEGRPSNGLETALDEGRKMADRLLESLKADRKELDALLKEHEVGTFGSILSGVASTGQQDKQIEGDQGKLTAAVRAATADYEDALSKSSSPEAAKAAGDKRNAAVRAAYESQIATYRTEAQRLKTEQADSEKNADFLPGRPGGSADVVVDNSAKIANIEGRTQQLQDALTREGLQESIATRNARDGVLKEQKSGGGDSDKANRDLLASIEQGLSERQAIRQLEPAEVAAYWSQYLATFQRGSSEYKKVLDEVTRFTQEASKQRFEAQLKVNPESALDLSATRAQREQAQAAIDKQQEEGARALERGTEAVDKWAAKTQEGVLRTGAQWTDYFRGVAKGQEITAAIADSISRAQLRALEASGGITALGAAQVEAALHAREHAAELKALQAELDRLQQGAPKAYDPISGQDQVTDSKAAAQIQQLKNQIAQLQGKGQAQSITDQSKVNQEIAKPYLTAFEDINNGWLKVQQDLIQGNGNIKRDFARMGLELVQETAKSFEMMLANTAKYEIEKLATHRAANAATQSGDVAAQAESTALAKTSNAEQKLDAAKTAFANTYASVSGWPIVGPVLAPVLAAGAFAAVAAFEQGTPMVPRTGLAMLHQGEAVLASPAAGVMREMMGGGGDRSGGDVHLHMGGNNFSSADGNFHDQFKANQRQITRTIQKWHREGTLKLGGVGR